MLKQIYIQLIFCSSHVASVQMQSFQELPPRMDKVGSTWLVLRYLR